MDRWKMMDYTTAALESCRATGHREASSSYGTDASDIAALILVNAFFYAGRSCQV